jgi:hypothetical protein
MRGVPILRLLPFLLLIALCGGCASKNKGKIEGTQWSSLSATMKGQPIPAGSMRLQFSGDGKVVYQVGPQTYKGTYSLGFGDLVTLHLNQQVAGRTTHTERVTIDGNKLTMTDSDGTALTFQKVN